MSSPTRRRTHYGYIQVFADVPVAVKNREIFRLACCSCGLVHDVTIDAPGLLPGSELTISLRENKEHTRIARKLPDLIPRVK